MVSKEVVEEIYHAATEDLPKVQTDEGFIASAKDQDFGVFFSRDAAIDSLFTLERFRQHPEQPLILIPVKTSLVTMALTQGRSVNLKRDEEPGKIIHEYRHDPAPKNQQRLQELKGKFPVEEKGGLLFMLYYGSIDATPLFEWDASEFLILTGDWELFEFLDPHLKAAFSWSHQKLHDPKSNGYVAYQPMNGEALINQGWKDSGNSILTPEGNHPEEPIALVEVQGYQYRALVVAAQLYLERSPGFARQLWRDAAALRERFNRDFWMEDEDFFAYAIDGNGNQIKEITSNVGHLIMSGIIDESKLSQVVKRLMQPDMLTPYGVRTLSVNSVNFSDEEPSAYHNGGGVWTHDNAIIYLGLKTRGFLKEAGMVRDANLEAQYILKKQYSLQDLELYMVDRFNRLRPYKTAQHPQSWAAAANLLWTDPLEIKALMAT